MPGSNSAFIPTINAITTSQDLQWMVQPTVITSMSNPYSRSHPYGHHLTNGPGLLTHNTLARPGVIRSTGDLRRRKREEQVSSLKVFFHSRTAYSSHRLFNTYIFLTCECSWPQRKRRRGEWGGRGTSWPQPNVETGGGSWQRCCRGWASHPADRRTNYLLRCTSQTFTWWKPELHSWFCNLAGLVWL